MADLKISQLPTASLPVSGSEVLPIVQSGITDQITIDNLLTRLTVAPPAIGTTTPAAMKATNVTVTGQMAVGGVITPGTAIALKGYLTGAAAAYQFFNVGTILHDVTVIAGACVTQPSTEAFVWTLPQINHYWATQGTFGAGSTVTAQYAYNADAGLIGATYNVGHYAGNTAAVGVGKTAWGFLSDVNVPSASGTTWGFMGRGSANNAYLGNSSFGKVTPPTCAVDTTSEAANLVTNTAATYTVLTTDSTIVQTTAASVYTLPAAASFPGRRLRLLTHFAGTVTSASSNVVPIAGGAAGTAILAATAGKWALLQSNGTNWLIVSAN